MGNATLPAKQLHHTEPSHVTWHSLTLEDHPIDQAPPIKVIVVGAGITGINAAALLPVKVPGLELVIYERSSDVVRTIPLHLRVSAAKLHPRAAFGTIASILVFNVMFHPTCISRRSRPREIGQSTTHRVRRSRHIGLQ
jgi:hypothetical protein